MGWSDGALTGLGLRSVLGGILGVLRGWNEHGGKSACIWEGGGGGRKQEYKRKELLKLVGILCRFT